MLAVERGWGAWSRSCDLLFKFETPSYLRNGSHLRTNFLHPVQRIGIRLGSNRLPAWNLSYTRWGEVVVRVVKCIWLTSAVESITRSAFNGRVSEPTRPSPFVLMSPSRIGETSLTGLANVDNSIVRRRSGSAMPWRVFSVRVSSFSEFHFYTGRHPGIGRSRCLRDSERQHACLSTSNASQAWWIPLQ